MASLSVFDSIEHRLNNVVDQAQRQNQMLERTNDILIAHLRSDERQRRINEVVHPIFSNSVYESYVVFSNCKVRHHPRGAEFLGDVIAFKKPMDQTEHEKWATVTTSNGETYWSAGSIILYPRSSWGYYYNVLNQEDLLIRIASAFSENLDRLGYSSCAVYDQNSFSKVCTLMPQGYGYHFVSLFHKIQENHDPVPKTYLELTDMRMKSSVMKKTKDNGLFR